MNFEHSDEQRQLADSVRRYLADHYGFEARKAMLASDTGLGESAWSTFAELGLLGLSIPEAHGGFGGTTADLMPAMEAFGEALVLEPVLDHLLAARLVALAGSAAQQAAVLPGAADGSLHLTAALLEPGRRYSLAPQSCTARADGGGWVLSGEKLVVVGAPSADRLVVSALTPAGASLFLVDRAAAGVQLSPYRTVDGQRAADIRFDGVRLGADALLGVDGQAQAAIDAAADFATVLACGEAIGAMAYANAATLEYTQQRKQFGVAIASFQVLQHRMVEMLIHLEQARSMAIAAASAVDQAASGAEGARQRAREVSAAKVKIADSARAVSQESVQLHGGMGMTEELKVSHTFRRLTVLAQLLGDADHHLERFAALG